MKRKVLKYCLKLSNDGECLIGRGISFRIWGEAEEKARRPNSVLVLGTSRRSWLEERRTRLAFLMSKHIVTTGHCCDLFVVQKPCVSLRVATKTRVASCRSSRSSALSCRASETLFTRSCRSSVMPTATYVHSLTPPTPPFSSRSWKWTPVYKMLKQRSKTFGTSLDHTRRGFRQLACYV